MQDIRNRTSRTHMSQDKGFVSGMAEVIVS